MWVLAAWKKRRVHWHRICQVIRPMLLPQAYQEFGEEKDGKDSNGDHDQADQAWPGTTEDVYNEHCQQHLTTIVHFDNMALCHQETAAFLLKLRVLSSDVAWLHQDTNADTVNADPDRASPKDRHCFADLCSKKLQVDMHESFPRNILETWSYLGGSADPASMRIPFASICFMLFWSQILNLFRKKMRWCARTKSLGHSFCIVCSRFFPVSLHFWNGWVLPICLEGNTSSSYFIDVNGCSEVRCS